MSVTPAEPAPLTGHDAIDAALTSLAESDPADLDAQLEAADGVHRALQAGLADLGG
ncbi:hypothetical protein [Janibacter sp. GXQ6167]|uniref:hypothetical protein n=1 Tax=Janibacter sp. GXQ6167 TaxID=3240791 RepID=UPI003526B1EB